MELKASEIAAIVSGIVVGDPNRVISCVASLEAANEHALSFYSNPKFATQFKHSKAGIIIVPAELNLTEQASRTFILSPNSALSFSRVMTLFENDKSKLKPGIEPFSFIHPSAIVGDQCYIGSFSYVGENAVIGNQTKIYPHTWIGSNTKIGHQCTLYAGVKVYPDSIIGNHCILHAGSVIGSDGFGFIQEKHHQFSKKIPQLGKVILENHVEIGANTVIDRATLDATIIKNGVKLDNLIQVGHNVIIGENTMIAAQTGIAGSALIGKDTRIGGQTGIAGHITIADGSTIQGQTGVTKSTKAGEQLYGTPGIPFIQFLKSYAIFKKLPELNKKINQILKLLNSDKR